MFTSSFFWLDVETVLCLSLFVLPVLDVSRSNWGSSSLMDTMRAKLTLDSSATVEFGNIIIISLLYRYNIIIISL